MEGMFLVLHDAKDGHPIYFQVIHMIGIDEKTTDKGELITNVMMSDGSWHQVREPAKEIENWLNMMRRNR